MEIFFYKGNENILENKKVLGEESSPETSFRKYKIRF